ncbi:NAD(P)H-dependent flavin oxidoreductase [Amycolatopsis thermoflava]|uniref:NAD(P)H-dependent flavin oxidoreductase n=1 Tax=Amycolatopsis thermoflava TaxID=84480 RepID=UPI003826C87E
MILPQIFPGRLKLPVIAAPMTGVSGTALVTAACRNGVIGSFPTHNAESSAELDEWLSAIHRDLADLGEAAAPVAPNLVVHRSNARLGADLDVLLRQGAELVITSVGSPAPVIGALHDTGARVFADVSSLRHVERAVDAGVDGLILLTAGAGGQTGTANPFAFVRAARERFDGTIVLAGGISDGASVLAAQILGADLVYMGTKFIATTESLADEDYRAELVRSNLDDVRTTSAAGGIPANLLNGGLGRLSEASRKATAPTGFEQDRLLSNRTVWSAGHSVSGVDSITPVAELVRTVRDEYESACEALLARTGPGHDGALTAGTR